jgi:Mg2+/Co2+ transporter CorC
MIENVLEIKDTHVREVMTPLVDVVAIDTSATLVDFHDLWVTHQYSRYIDTFSDCTVILFFFLFFPLICNMLPC